ncbi:MAG TPA: energy-coupling factor transporter ATPase [Acholeplasmatales bacterium]|nr:energy-coupling factor transporter ATPase [Acholeplasmatales bacterium]
MIKAEHINFSYRPNELVVKDVSFSIEKGEFVCMIGHNGSGKSTIAKLLTGLLPVDSGEISIDGTVLNEKTINDLRQRIGIVFQNPDNQFVGVTVRDDIAFGLENRQIERTTMLELIDKYSKLVKMENFLDYNPENLSGGEKQRVALAGVLATDPDIIIFDEATSMLDPKGVKEVNDVIKELKGHKTIIAITHNLDEAIYADRVIVLAEGRIVMNDVPKAVFMQKELLKSSSLDILESMKLIELIEKNPKLNHKKEIEELLWELSFQK